MVAIKNDFGREQFPTPGMKVPSMEPRISPA